jgi:hypothetical protein
VAAEKKYFSASNMTKNQLACVEKMSIKNLILVFQSGNLHLCWQKSYFSFSIWQSPSVLASIYNAESIIHHSVFDSCVWRNLGDS